MKNVNVPTSSQIIILSTLCGCCSRGKIGPEIGLEICHYDYDCNDKYDY